MVRFDLRAGWGYTIQHRSVVSLQWISDKEMTRWILPSTSSGFTQNSCQGFYPNLSLDNQSLTGLTGDDMSNTPRVNSEDKVRDFLMTILYGHIGVHGSWQGDNKTASFRVASDSVNGKCQAEWPLTYNLPGGATLSHVSDILLTFNRRAGASASVEYVSIEIKHKSAVTDQFKCRSYDMLHLKQTFGSQIHGVMVFVRADKGIQFNQAKKICYPYDYFFGIEFVKMKQSAVWNDLLTALATILS